eukprot:1573496-Pleurochrysis_carterae.AAC.2
MRRSPARALASLRGEPPRRRPRRRAARCSPPAPPPPATRKAAKAQTRPVSVRRLSACLDARILRCGGVARGRRTRIALPRRLACAACQLLAALLGAGSASGSGGANGGSSDSRKSSASRPSSTTAASLASIAASSCSAARASRDRHATSHRRCGIGDVTSTTRHWRRAWWRRRR